MQDFRRALDDKDIDAIVIAAPNHWHALATVWGLQAGKHVFVEKPASHTVLEGRLMIEATARYKKMVQVGTMNRSRPPVMEAIKFIHDGGIGKVYMARGLCFKPRPSIGKYPDGPMAPGEKYALTVGSTNYEPTYDEQYLSKVDYDMWLGPAPKRTFNRNRFHYNWHWHWDYGNGDTGNQGPHQFDTARWGLNKQEHPVRIQSSGGYFNTEASQETPDIHTTMFEYADGTILEFATRGEFTNDEGTQRIGNLFYGSKGWVWIDGDGRKWQSYFGPKNEKGPGADVPDTSRRQRSARHHEHRVAALPQLHRRHSRRRCEGADQRHPRRAPVVDAAPPGEHRLSHRPRAAVRRQVGNVRQRQEGRQAADARVSKGIRDPEADVKRLVVAGVFVSDSGLMGAAADTPLTLDTQDYLTLPITGKLDGTGQTDGMLARINSFREEPFDSRPPALPEARSLRTGRHEAVLPPRSERPALHPRREVEGADDLSRLQRAQRAAGRVPQAGVGSGLRQRPDEFSVRSRLRRERKVLHGPHRRADGRRVEPSRQHQLQGLERRGLHARPRRS